MFHRSAIWFAASLCTSLLAGQPAAIAADESSSANAPAAAESAESYYISKTVEMRLADAKAKVTELLAAEKFAVLFEIDFQVKVKEKLNIDIPGYTILGACSAKFAHSIWLDEPHIGALLPCNCVLRELPDGKTEVFFKDPRGLIGATRNPAIEDEVASVSAIVEKVLAAL
jgi:uncharacterized protein (DUF302 family)